MNTSVLSGPRGLRRTAPRPGWAHRTNDACEGIGDGFRRAVKTSAACELPRSGDDAVCGGAQAHRAKE
jgi:hypothetical protein